MHMTITYNHSHNMRDASTLYFFMYYLVCPFDDDTLDSILELDITLPARRGAGLALLFINILCSLQWTQVKCKIFHVLAIRNE